MTSKMFGVIASNAPASPAPGRAGQRQSPIGSGGEIDAVGDGNGRVDPADVVRLLDRL